MRKVAIIATVIATLLYAASTYLYMYDPIAKSDEPGTHLFNFLMWYTLPIVLWVIYFIINESKKPNSKIPRFTNSNLKVNTYYIQENGSTSESLTFNQLSLKKINKDTYVWRKGIEWTKAGELRELKQLFEQNTPPPFENNKLKNNIDQNYKQNRKAQILAILLIPMILIILYIVESLESFFAAL
jgi:hypothetical protein